MNRARWAGAALILATNAVVLLGVAYNRSDEPESRLVLSERELWLQRRYWNQPRSEDSGVALSLKWDVLGAEPQERSGPRDFCAPQPVEWFDAAKLAEIGFDVEQPFEDDPERRHEGYDNRQPARDAFLVLELDGPAYHTALERARSRAQSAADRYAADPDDAELAESAQAMQQRLAEQERLESRLFVVDAGLDPQALRARHSDRARYAIVRGQVRAWMSSRGCPLGQFRGGPGFWGYVDSLSNDSLHVDLRLRPAITPLLSEGAAATSESAWHAQIHMAVGRRFEPWITDITVTRRE